MARLPNYYWATMALWVFMVIIFPHVSRQQANLIALVDRAETMPQDYAIRVTGLPPDATNEEEIKTFVEQHALDRPVEVVKVVVAYNMGRYHTTRDDLKSALNKRNTLKLEGKDESDEDFKI